MKKTTEQKPATATLNRSEYEDIQALSFSGMKELIKSPAHYKAWLTRPREETKALRIGSAVHMAALQPDKFIRSYAMAPEADRRTKEGKAVWEAFQSSLKEGQVGLAFDEYNQVITLADAFKTTAEQAGIEDCFSSDAWVECPLTAKDHRTPIKGIPDSVAPTGWIYDLKTTSDDCTERSALRTILSWGYHVQAAHYCNLVRAYRDEVKGFRIVFVEKETGQGAVYEIAGDLLIDGMTKCNLAYVAYETCLQQDNWYSLAQSGVTRLDKLPGKQAATITV
jgi:exodeoxyribonuclease VIII